MRGTQLLGKQCRACDDRTADDSRQRGCNVRIVSHAGIPKHRLNDGRVGLIEDTDAGEAKHDHKEPRPTGSAGCGLQRVSDLRHQRSAAEHTLGDLFPIGQP